MLAREAAVAAAGNSTVVWPWCNTNYPISNFAGMWPTDEVGCLLTGHDTARIGDKAGVTVPWVCLHG